MTTGSGYGGPGFGGSGHGGSGFRGVDPYAEWDAAYVLGSLSGEERRAYEDHLAGCARCRTAVAELAGLPGMLAAVPTEEALALQPLPPADRTAPPRIRQLLPGRQRWLGRLLVAAVLAVTLVAGGVGGYLLGEHSRPSAPASSGQPSTASFRVAFSDVQPTGMTAVADVVPQTDRTRITVECQYASGGPYAQSSWARYAIDVVDRSGRRVQVTAWDAAPGRVMHPSGSADVPVGQIAAIEIRAVDGDRTVMRARI